MADQKDDVGQAVKPGQAKRAAQSSGATEQVAAPDRAAADERSGSANDAPDRPAATVKPPDTVVRRKQRYLIGFRTLPGITLPPNDPFLERIAEMEGVEIIRRIQSRNCQPISQSIGIPQTIASVPAAGMASTVAPAIAPQEIIVVRMDEQRGEALRQNAPPHVVVELDAPLGYSHLAIPEFMSWQLAVRAMPFPRPRREIRVRVLGERDRPLANAVVNVYGAGFPAQTITDSSGHASLQTDGTDGGGALAIYVRPTADHWERYIQNPVLESGQVNVVRLSPLSPTSGNFPGERPYGWGQRIMKFDRLSADWNGTGTKIGMIDSGCDNSHPLLRHIVRGVDVTQGNDAQSWKSDELGHGTHCVGIVAASSAPEAGMIGCAPASEVHVFKVLPGGYFSDLIDALDQCIERRLDIVQIGATGEHFSELVAQKITEARLNGIACIAPAGNSAGAVQFPANVPGVLTVSAVGKLGEYPQDTRHAQRALPQFISVSGIYATNFSCFGPQVSICAPGVAIVSSVPGGGCAAWDGTSMAAAHVVGFSALLLSHHPMLQSINYGARAEQRVSVLFDLIRAAAMPYAQVEPQRVGAGLPDLQQVPGLLATTQQFAGQQFLGSGTGVLPAQMALPAAYLANSTDAAILQLRAAGLWPG